MESNYYQVPLPFIGTFRIFLAQKCCQNLAFLFRELEVKWGIAHLAAFQLFLEQF